MNWHLLLKLLDFANSVYWDFYWYSYLLANVCWLVKLFTSKAEAPYWNMVKIFRFVYPVRIFMCVFTIIIYILLHPHLKLYDYFVIVFLIVTTIFYIDNFGDDPRDKKKSKVLEKIKSLGHRLVVEPA